MPEFDLEATIRAFLRNAPRINALVTTRVYASLNLELPEGYDVTVGPALVIGTRSGGASAHAPLINPMLYARCYGTDPRTAWALDRALIASLHTKKFGPVKMALLMAPGQLLAEADPRWPYVFSVYRLTTALFT
jgi:hypothetical protein